MRTIETIKEQLAICLIQESEICKVYSGDVFIGFLSKDNSIEQNHKVFEKLLDHVVNETAKEISKELKVQIPFMVSEINKEFQRSNLQLAPKRKGFLSWF